MKIIKDNLATNYDKRIASFDISKTNTGIVVCDYKGDALVGMFFAVHSMPTKVTIDKDALIDLYKDKTFTFIMDTADEIIIEELYLFNRGMTSRIAVDNLSKARGMFQIAMSYHNKKVIKEESTARITTSFVNELGKEYFAGLKPKPKRVKILEKLFGDDIFEGVLKKDLYDLSDALLMNIGYFQNRNKLGKPDGRPMWK